MNYQVERDTGYDFLDESYASTYPNLHKYPATMLPKIGIKLLKTFDIKGGTLCDPYCGSGSSFMSGLECGIREMHGFDINPLAILISRSKFTKLNLDSIHKAARRLKYAVAECLENKNKVNGFALPKITNIDYWFSKEAVKNLNILRYFIYEIKDKSLRNMFFIPFSETVRDCSYTRKSEFKLYRMKECDLADFSPNVIETYFKKLDEIIAIYSNVYLPKLTDDIEIKINYSEFKFQNKYYDTVLTSPPYGDSRTTVAYGQFATLSHEWMGIEHARKIDALLMGGQKTNRLYQNGIITDYISQIDQQDHKRALEMSAFYYDLKTSINEVAKSIKPKGYIFYIVGNRTVKNIQLVTDQFVAEKFENNGFDHLITIKRALSSKAMPSQNSPTNQKGKLAKTMLFEYIVVCRKH